MERVAVVRSVFRSRWAVSGSVSLGGGIRPRRRRKMIWLLGRGLLDGSSLPIYLKFNK